ncbi:MAG: MotB family protein [Hyphomicrobium sp.]
MSVGQIDVAAQPLVIVKRRGGGEDGHHGGAWKIAYADFMTAMMAFFLVMWLVNAADKKTIVQVAAYFNPMHLTDRTKANTGLEDQNEEPLSKDRKKKVAAKDAKLSKDDAHDDAQNKLDAKPLEKTAAADQVMLADPVAAIDQILSAAPPQRARISASSKFAELHDPFEPKSRGATEPARPAGKEATAPAPLRDNAVQPDKEAAFDAQKVVGGESATPAKNSKIAKENAGAKLPQPVAALEEYKLAEKAAAAKLLTEKIKTAVHSTVNLPPELEVKVTPEGLLVSVSDTLENGMFEVGSAKPKMETIMVLEKIGGILKGQEGSIVLRGHTDGRAYRNGGYDNWRLSTARAHMAYHMLTRGGVDETRFLGVEGRADRELKAPADKDAAQNRRIEILILDKPK